MRSAEESAGVLLHSSSSCVGARRAAWPDRPKRGPTGQAPQSARAYGACALASARRRAVTPRSRGLRRHAGHARCAGARRRAVCDSPVLRSVGACGARALRRACVRARSPPPRPGGPCPPALPRAPGWPHGRGRNLAVFNTHFDVLPLKSESARSK